jgi:hypothetical protein
MSIAEFSDQQPPYGILEDVRNLMDNHQRNQRSLIESITDNREYMVGGA